MTPPDKNHPLKKPFFSTMKKPLGVLFIVFAAWQMVGCKYDKLALAESVTTCDTTGMTYTSSIEPIIKSNCYSCHAGTASGSFGINLDSYASLKLEAQSGELLNRLTSTDASVMMPKGGPKLSDCDINKINAWIQAGAPQ